MIQLPEKKQIQGAAAGKGRGKEVLGVVRTAELILIIICFRADGTINFDDLTAIRKEIYDAGIRLNEEPPRIQIKERTKGGIHFTFKGNNRVTIINRKLVFH